MSNDLIMNIGSVSKTITTTAVLQLWEKGLIDLDEDINKYVSFKVRNPNHPNLAITVRQILTHTSSIRDGSVYDNSYSCGDPKISLKHWIKNYLMPDGEYYNQKENYNDWKPGSESDYSNVAFGLLGYLIEEVSQMPFNEYCKKNIFTPLHMNNTGWYLSEVNLENHIVPYKYLFDKHLIKGFNSQSKKENNKNIPLCFYSFPNYPDGLLKTSVHDLSNFLIAIMNNNKFNDSQILKESTIKEMLTRQESNDYQGLCWGTWAMKSLWGHSGGDPGIRTHMHFDPDAKIGVITFRNNDNDYSYDVVKALYNITKKMDE
jgi:CubicO group peptidase (beta-lactamase class C family)